MRIAEIVSGLLVNGAAAHAVQLAAHLAARGHEVTLVCLPGGWVARHAPAGVEVVTSDLHRWPADELRRIAAFVGSRGIQVVHTHMSRAHVFGVLLKVLAGIPVVATAHSSRLQPHWMLNDRVIAVSHAVSRFQRRWNRVNEVRLSVIHNFVDPRQFDLPADTRGRVRRSLGIDESAFLIGKVGNVFVEKGVHVLIDAMPLIAARVPEARLLVVGRGPDDYRRALISRAHRLEVAGRIIWSAEVDDVRDTMAALDVLAVPSLEEPLSMVCLEGMAARLPAVATRVGGLTDLVCDGECGCLVPPSSSEALAEAIVTLARDRERRLRFGAAARERVERHFAPGVIVPQVEAVLAAAAARSEGASRRRVS